jgi:hypothetical protein
MRSNGPAMTHAERQKRYRANKRAKLAAMVAASATSVQLSRSPVPAEPASREFSPGPVPNGDDDDPSLAEAKRRRAWADAQSAELNLLRLEGRLVGAEGVRAAITNMTAMFPAMIRGAIHEALGKSPKSPAERTRMAQQLARECCGRIAQELKRAAEGLADA